MHFEAYFVQSERGTYIQREVVSCGKKLVVDIFTRRRPLGDLHSPRCRDNRLGKSLAEGCYLRGSSRVSIRREARA